MYTYSRRSFHHMSDISWKQKLIGNHHIPEKKCTWRDALLTHVDLARFGAKLTCKDKSTNFLFILGYLLIILLLLIIY